MIRRTFLKLLGLTPAAPKVAGQALAAAPIPTAPVFESLPPACPCDGRGVYITRVSLPTAGWASLNSGMIPTRSTTRLVRCGCKSKVYSVDEQQMIEDFANMIGVPTNVVKGDA